MSRNTNLATSSDRAMGVIQRISQMAVRNRRGAMALFNSWYSGECTRRSRCRISWIRLAVSQSMREAMCGRIGRFRGRVMPAE